MISVEEILKLWDFQDPSGSEVRFRAAYEASASLLKDIYLTQVARTFGLRKDFAAARRVLDSIANVEALPAEVRAWYWLERGRTLASAAHTDEQLTEAAREEARACYERAIACAEEAQLDYVAVDTLHMMVMVDREPQQQLEWNRRTLARIQASKDKLVSKWLGPIHNNVGYALHLDGRYDEALAEFAFSRQAYADRGDEASVRVADWMTAWTYRVMGRQADALALQLANEKANAEAGTPDFYVFEELETLYRLQGDEAKAEHYRGLAYSAKL